MAALPITPGAGFMEGVSQAVGTLGRLVDIQRQALDMRRIRESAPLEMALKEETLKQQQINTKLLEQQKAVADIQLKRLQDLQTMKIPIQELTSSGLIPEKFANWAKGVFGSFIKKDEITGQEYITGADLHTINDILTSHAGILSGLSEITAQSMLNALAEELIYTENKIYDLKKQLIQPGTNKDKLSNEVKEWEQKREVLRERAQNVIEFLSFFRKPDLIWTAKQREIELQRALNALYAQGAKNEVEAERLELLRQRLELEKQKLEKEGKVEFKIVPDPYTGRIIIAYYDPEDKDFKVKVISPGVPQKGSTEGKPTSKPVNVEATKEGNVTVPPQ